MSASSNRVLTAWHQRFPELAARAEWQRKRLSPDGVHARFALLLLTWRANAPERIALNAQ